MSVLIGGSLKLLFSSCWAHGCTGLASVVLEAEGGLPRSVPLLWLTGWQQRTTTPLRRGAAGETALGCQ